MDVLITFATQIIVWFAVAFQHQTKNLVHSRGSFNTAKFENLASAMLKFQNFQDIMPCHLDVSKDRGALKLYDTV
jgi:hypothetical protein